LQVNAKSAALVRWMLRFLELALLVGLILGLHAYQTRGLVSGSAPMFSGELLDGEAVSLGDYYGRPVLLHFWATWCPVCRLEQSSIDRIAREHPVLTVALDELSANDMRDWMTEQGVSYPVVRDPSGVVAAQFGVSGVPTSMVVDAQGRIRFVAVGYTTEAGLRLRLWWAAK